MSTSTSRTKTYVALDAEQLLHEINEQIFNWKVVLYDPDVTEYVAVMAQSQLDTLYAQIQTILDAEVLTADYS